MYVNVGFAVVSCIVVLVYVEMRYDTFTLTCATLFICVPNVIRMCT